MAKKGAQQDAARFRDRIIGLRRVKGRELKKNPNNFRVHSDTQRAALREVLGEIGFAGAALAFKNEDGQLELIDGHLRADMADDDEMPVIETDLTRAEAQKVLATFDTIGGMAQLDEDALAALLEEVEVESDALASVFDELLGPAPKKVSPEGLTEREVRPLPKLTWVLVSVPTLEYGKIAQHVEAIAAVPDCNIYMTANDGDREKD